MGVDWSRVRSGAGKIVAASFSGWLGYRILLDEVPVVDRLVGFLEENWPKMPHFVKDIDIVEKLGGTYLDNYIAAGALAYVVFKFGWKGLCDIRDSLSGYDRYSE
jgi:hypothetical protein